MTQQTHKLSLFEKVGYGLGDGASNLIWMIFIYYQNIFYTDVFGLAPQALAMMLAITRIWDMLIDIVIGLTADRTKTRWGKFRPYLLWMAVPFGVASVLAFTTPPFGPMAKLVYAYITLSLMMIVYSLINVPYGALMGVISGDSQERTSLASWRFSFAFGAGLFVQFSTPILVEHFGHGNKQLGYELTVSLYAVIAVVMFLATFAATRERVEPPRQQKTSARQDLFDLVTNLPWVMLCLIGILQVFFVAIRGASIAYYFTYYMFDAVVTLAGVPVHLGGAVGMGLFIVAGTVLSLLGTFLIQYVTPFTGRKKAFIGLMLLSSIVLVLSYWVRPDQIYLLYGYNLLYSLLTGPTAALLWAMFADSADYSEWRTGRRATGLVFSAAGMSNKFGWAIGGALAASVLAIYGYHANMVQTAHAQEGIRIIMALAPAAGTLLCALGMMGYRLNEAAMKKIHAELDVSRTKEIAGA